MRCLRTDANLMTHTQSVPQPFQKHVEIQTPSSPPCVRSENSNRSRRHLEQRLLYHFLHIIEGEGKVILEFGRGGVKLVILQAM